MASLVDTNILVYCYDFRDPQKRRRAKAILDQGAREGSLVVPHQAILEFVAATTRRGGGRGRLLEIPEAIRAAGFLMQEFDILYPDEAVLQAAFSGSAVHQLPWYDAHIWAYAEANGIPEILSEDFEHGRIYGGVRVVNPFLERDPPGGGGPTRSPAG